MGKTRTCEREGCDNTFYPRRKGHRFCSRKCFSAYIKAHPTERMIEHGRKLGGMNKAKGAGYFSGMGKTGGGTTAARGSSYFSEIGKIGGASVKAKYGPEHFNLLGELGGECLLKKLGDGAQDFYRKIGSDGGRRSANFRFFKRTVQAAIDAHRRRYVALGLDYRGPDFPDYTQGDFISAVLSIHTQEEAEKFYDGYVCWLKKRPLEEGGTPEEKAVEGIVGCFFEAMSYDDIEMWHGVLGLEYSSDQRVLLVEEVA